MGTSSLVANPLSAFSMVTTSQLYATAWIMTFGNFLSSSAVTTRLALNPAKRICIDTAIIQVTVFCGVTSCTLLDICVEPAASLSSENGGSRLFRNICACLPEYKVYHHRGQLRPHLLSWEHRNSHIFPRFLKYCKY